MMQSSIRQVARQQHINEEASRILDAFCAMPLFRTTCTTAVLRRLLLDNDGQVLARGRLSDIKSKHLGAGVYRVWLDVEES